MPSEVDLLGKGSNLSGMLGQHHSLKALHNEAYSYCSFISAKKRMWILDVTTWQCGIIHSFQQLWHHLLLGEKQTRKHVLFENCTSPPPCWQQSKFKFINTHTCVAMILSCLVCVTSLESLAPAVRTLSVCAWAVTLVGSSLCNRVQPLEMLLATHL